MIEHIPSLPYRLFFLVIEPLSAIVGAFYAACRPSEYLQLLSNPSVTAISQVATSPTPTSTFISLYQLGNLYLLFALNEHLVLASTNSFTTWRRLLSCLLIADFGHLATMWPLAVEKGISAVYFRFWEWNAMEWGSVGFVYLGALMRISFLIGLGIRRGPRDFKKRGRRRVVIPKAD